MTEIQVVSIDRTNNYLINDFLSNAGKSLDSFRYYKNRTIFAIDHHICTYLFIKNNLPVCYGHLDKEVDTVWLGIAVIESETGKGLGKTMMNYLIQNAEKKNIPSLHLTVDIYNEAAIRLYEKSGFKIEAKFPTYLKYRLNIDK